MKRIVSKKLPLVTVIMTAYNAAKYICDALDSIVGQTHKNLEIIVVDDGSVDDTYQLTRIYSRVDKRVKVYSMGRNTGPSKASNFALKIARGEFIARMDADDVAVSDRIEKQVKFLLQHPEIVIVGGQCSLIGENGAIIGEKNYPLTHKDIYGSLFIMNPIQHPACMFRRNLLPKGTIFYHNHSFLAHDLELIFEIAQYGKLANIPDTILYYRCHKNSLSLKDPKETFTATVEVRKKAMEKYDYMPTLRGWFTHYCQALLVYLLPNKVIYMLFQIWRIKKSANDFKIIFSPAQQRLNQLAYRWLGIIL